MTNVRRSDKPAVREESAAYDPFDRHEMIGGIRYDLLPAPSVPHQIIGLELCNSLKSTCHREGFVMVSPVDVRFDGDNVAQPDVVMVTHEKMHMVRRRGIFGAPDLLVEILSPSSGTHDKVRKKALYERFGVQEYWIVDPVHCTVDQFVLHNEKLQLLATYGGTSTLTSPNFPSIAVDVKQAFDAIARFRKDDE